MACLALSLQPTNGPDILLQTREWFPPARALVALSSFRQTRISFSTKNATSSAAAAASIDDADSSLGDDPLAASSGQVVVGVESRYRVVYRLVNSIYVLGIATVDDLNVFSCISTVNQAVSVVVSACRGVDVTPEKLQRKYAEVYIALDLVLRGVSSVRLSTILTSIHGEGIAKIVHSGVDSEARVRGADTWSESLSLEHQSNVEIFSNSQFELPPETIIAGDEAAAALAPPPATSDQTEEAPAAPVESPAEKDPFAASDAINKPPEEALVGEFKKTKDPTGLSDAAAALAGLEVTTLPPSAETKPVAVGVPGFEGNYGGIEFGKEEASLSEAFEGFDNAFGGGLDASEFIETSAKAKKDRGLGGLELLETSDAPAPTAAGAADAKTPLENLLVTKTEMKGPELHIYEEINAEFDESVLRRVSLLGLVYLKTMPSKDTGGKETEFSFRLDGTEGIKRVVMQSAIVSSLGNGMFHVRTPPLEKPVPVVKFSLQPRLTPIPLRVRLTKRHSGTLLSVMIQYVSNPTMMVPLNDVTFILKLPVDPTLLKVSPKAVLNRSERELRWHIQEIPMKARPGCLKARMPVESSEGEEEIEVVGYVKFSVQGGSTLSGVLPRPVTEGKVDFYEGKHMYSSGIYMCN
ncbi:hypothetical protein QJS04_geneDACA004002 [Acorus gramineus]|uniref:MHD domain-containing protein n=1 Tax=Acorus gramineus TaxID=55184 RepID=A0AAV9BI18_ACOGR|nr:hypothetical protein QJS04_geneDACA004002 [Acorus gramineus]